MVFAGAELLDCRAMVQSWVAFVDRPAVVGMHLVQVAHDSITVRFRKHTGGGNGAKTAITLDVAGMRNACVGYETVAIDQKMLWPHEERIHGTVHRAERSVEDVDRVDLHWIHHRHCPGERPLFDQGSKRFARDFAQFLAIVQTGQFHTRWQYHSRSHDRAGETTTARFITTGFEQVLVMVSCEGHDDQVFNFNPASEHIRSKLAHKDSAALSHV